MTPTLAFTAAFCVTLALLGVVAWSGIRAKRRVHVPAVGLTGISLGVTIWFAYRLGHTLDLASAGIITPIHLTLARIATLAILAAIVMGLVALRSPNRIRLHKRVAWIALSLVVLSAITGVAMVSMASTIAP